MTSYSDRPAVRRRIVDVLRTTGDLGGVQVSYSYPQATARNDAIWLGGVEGAQEQVSFGDSRPGRDDRWTINVVVATTGHKDEETADARCQEMVSAVGEALFAGPRLGEEYKSTALYPGKIDGPNSVRATPSEPALSVAELTIEIVVPLRGQ